MPREAVDVPSLEEFQSRLDGALGNLVQREDGIEWFLRPFPDHSVILYLLFASVAVLGLHQGFGSREAAEVASANRVLPLYHLGVGSRGEWMVGRCLQFAFSFSLL